MRKILEYRKGERFDDAVAIALKGVEGQPPDDFLLQTIADTYFQRAQMDKAKREQYVELAVQYSERALRASPENIVNVFKVGEDYLVAAMNFEKPSSCGYYKKSLEIFQRLQTNPELQGELGIIGGEQVHMAPYRERLEREIKETRLLAAECPVAGDK